jgi:phospholipid/cholesterol/gamma-HCH transport system substrate-binding protein
MRRTHRHPFASGLVTAVVLVAVMAAVIVSGIPGGPQITLPWNHTMTLKVALANADALAPHASVEVAGVKVGEVRSVDAKGTLALATLQLDDQYPGIHANATVYLRAHGLFGPKYIDIVPGTSAAPLLRDGATIGVDHTVQPVDLDQVLQALQAPEQQDLETTIVQLGAATANEGNNINELLAASNSLTKVLDSPIRAVDAVAPQLSDMLVQSEAFNSDFAQAPLDTLVANSEQTLQAVAANSGHLESILSQANSTFNQLDTDLSGQSGNVASIIQTLGEPGGTLDRLNKLTYIFALFSANLTGKEAALGSDPASLSVVNGLVSAITSVASAFSYADPCPPTQGPPGSTNDSHCSVSPDGQDHYLQALLLNFPPSGGINPSVASLPGASDPNQYVGAQLQLFADAFAP